VYASVEDACEKVIKTNTPQKPILDNTRKYNKVYSIYRDLYGKLKEEYKQLNTLDV
jgi:xylulokinase